MRRAGATAGDPLRRERRRARLAGRRHGGLEPSGGVPRAAVRRDRNPHAGGSGAARAGPDGGPLRARGRRGDRRSSPGTASASRTALARTATSAAASPRCGSSARPGWPSRSRPTAPPRPRRSTCSRRSERRSSARAPVKGGPMHCTAADALELATLGGARVLGMDDRIGSLVPGKQADLAVISLVNSPFDPVEDPVTAAVLGGSPDRVTATLVAGEQRYLKGTSRWPDSTRAARSARSRMLP